MMQRRIISIIMSLAFGSLSYTYTPEELFRDYKDPALNSEISIKVNAGKVIACKVIERLQTTYWQDVKPDEIHVYPQLINIQPRSEIIFKVGPEIAQRIDRDINFRAQEVQGSFYKRIWNVTQQASVAIIPEAPPGKTEPKCSSPTYTINGLSSVHLTPLGKAALGITTLATIGGLAYYMKNKAAIKKSFSSGRKPITVRA